MKKILVFLSIVFVLVLCSCSKTTNKKTYSTYFGTVFQITLYEEKSSDADEAFSDIDEILSYYHSLTDRYYNHGTTKGVYYINHHLNEEIVIDKELFDLIEYSINLSKTLCEIEYFNILVGSLSDLYHDLFMNHNGEVVDESLLPSLGTYNFNLDDIELNSNTCSIKLKDNMSLDLGGIAKGYVTDKIIEYLNINNMKYVINAGMSTIYTNYGNPQRENNDFIVGLTNPKNQKETFYKLTAPLNMAISVSGDYQRYFIVNDRIYSHILDTTTLESVVSDIRSITVLSDTCAYGDVLSTTLFMMGSVNAITYMEENNIKGIIYKNDDTYSLINME